MMCEVYSLRSRWVRPPPCSWKCSPSTSHTYHSTLDPVLYLLSTLSAILHMLSLQVYPLYCPWILANLTPCTARRIPPIIASVRSMSSQPLSFVYGHCNANGFSFNIAPYYLQPHHLLCTIWPYYYWYLLLWHQIHYVPKDTWTPIYMYSKTVIFNNVV